MALPPGQKASELFPRFGLPQYTNRFPTETEHTELNITGDIKEEFSVADLFSKLSRVDQVSDFHCVTTWSKCGFKWSGVRFSDFYNQLVLPNVTEEITTVVLKCQDGFMTSLPLEDLLKPNVLLADKLNNVPLTIAHGAPIRIIAPNHYGYKNPKHLNRIGFYKTPPKLKSGLAKMIDHPRARVAQEERANFAPGWFLRVPYKFGIQSTIKDYQKALDKHLSKKQK